MEEAFTIDELIERLKGIRETEGHDLPVAMSDENDGCHQGVRVYCHNVVWDNDPGEKPERHCVLERY